jgi:hypothetical protein
MKYFGTIRKSLIGTKSIGKKEPLRVFDTQYPKESSP